MTTTRARPGAPWLVVAAPAAFYAVYALGARGWPPGWGRGLSWTPLLMAAGPAMVAAAVAGAALHRRWPVPAPGVPPRSPPWWAWH